MSDMPDKIWAGMAHGETSGVDWSVEKAFQMDVEYIRKDSITPQMAAEALLKAVQPHDQTINGIVASTFFVHTLKAISQQESGE